MTIEGFVSSLHSSPYLPYLPSSNIRLHLHLDLHLHLHLKIHEDNSIYFHHHDDYQLLRDHTRPLSTL